MSSKDDESIDDALEVEVSLQSDAAAAPIVKAEVVTNDEHGLVVKFIGEQFTKLPEVAEALPLLKKGEEVVTVWARITDKIPDQLLQEGQTILAWMRVKKDDGKFVTKTALFSLGAVAAITITRRAVHHYKSR